MCFMDLFGGGKPKLPAPVQVPQLKIPQQAPVQEQQPQTQSGVDTANKAKQPRKKSIFQIDLTIPSSNSSTSGAGGSTSSTGAAIR